MPIFVIHHHFARKEHWDLRLEFAGVLKSWALPKPPPRTKGIKRLAIQVEDHLKSYADFQGEIKEGYGKGTVKIWDKGIYRLESKEPEKIVFYLKGKLLNGRYVLLKTNFGEKNNNWLFFRV